jgi:hypothetical protein
MVRGDYFIDYYRIYGIIGGVIENSKDGLVGEGLTILQINPIFYKKLQ